MLKRKLRRKEEKIKVIVIEIGEEKEEKEA